MLDRATLDRLAMELHESPGNMAALENGAGYVPLHMIRRTLDLIANASVRAQVFVAANETGSAAATTQSTSRRW